jgi:hypothetical protein
VELISLSYLSLLVSGPMTKVIVQGKSGQPLAYYFTQPLACSWGDLLFYHSFLIVPETLFLSKYDTNIYKVKSVNLYKIMS